MSAPSIIRRAVEPFGAAGSVRVLLASDRVAARLTLEAVLEKSGYAVDSAVSAADAMEQLESQQYDLVLCDLERDCSELRRFAAAQPHRPATATLHVSHELPQDDLQEGEVLVAPVDIHLLLTQIADLVAHRAHGRANRAAAAQVRAS
ncbi:MAG: response regulator [Acidobacteria bacterium]|nr:response regulator [Acidobacteriota bacterium]